VKTYSVVFTPEAEEQLANLYHYIADHGSPKIAERYTSAIIGYCEGMLSLGSSRAYSGRVAGCGRSVSSGAQVSAATAKASRENGKRGGRPKDAVAA
jgi:plasmid stabilization system protein ParE